jgi:phosphatidylserine decarboxylase
LTAQISRLQKFSADAGIDLSECLDAPSTLDTVRKLFERKIRYWDVRPAPNHPNAILSPADSRMIAGSFSKTSDLFIKEKFFQFEELLGEKTEWVTCFRDGDYAVFRLTPDKYHYNHAPVSGIVADIYEFDGSYHPCNPGALMCLAAPLSKNKRVITVLDTDVPNGSNVGMTAMIEVAALMIGDIVQCYSEDKYDSPKPAVKGMFLKKGQPKSLYRPGSSTDILIFQKNRIRFSPDIIANLYRSDVKTRFSEGLGRSLVETEVTVRSQIGESLS